MKVLKYDVALKNDWNIFVQNSKNGSFLLDRNFMEYHSDRYLDNSLLVYNSGEIVAVVPASLSLDGREIVSHAGLTYGGVLISENLSLIKCIEIYYSILKYLYDGKIEALILKPIPRIYNRLPSDELDWIVFKTGALLFRRDLTFSLEIKHGVRIQKRKERNLKKIEKLEPLLEEAQLGDLEFFWREVLVRNLESSHRTTPIHSFDEITRLMESFPENIKCLVVKIGEEVVCGAILFLNKMVVHSQYIAASEHGKKIGALDFLFITILKNYKKEYRYLNFGTCSEMNKTCFNWGLVQWKEGFGAKPISHDFYSIETSSYENLKEVIFDK